MDHSVGLLTSLGEDLKLEVVKALRRTADKASMQAVLQTSRDMRRRASSLINKLVVGWDGANAMTHFPRQAIITSLELQLRLIFVVEWLDTAALTGRLLPVTRAHLAVPHEEQHYGHEGLDALGAIVAALAQACPNLRSLVVSCTDLSSGILTKAFFAALRDHLPNLTQLEVVELGGRWPSFSLASEGINWVACLPAGLTKLHLNEVNLHHSLLQHLVRMPHLVDVQAWSLSSEDELHMPVQSDSCAWRKLQLGCMFPDFRDVCRFSTWPSSVQVVEIDRPDRSCFEDVLTSCQWMLDPPSAAQTDAVAAAAQKLATCNISLSGTFTVIWKQMPDIASSTADILSALAPLAGRIPSLGLRNWPITSALLDELVLSLPHTHTLVIEEECTISSEAWVRLLTLSSVTTLTFLAKVPLAEAVALAVSVPRAIHLSFGCNGYPAFRTRRERATWDTFVASLAARRTALGLPPVIIVVPLTPEDENSDDI